MKVYKFNALLQHNGWISPAYVGIGPNGVLAYLSENPPAESTAIESVKGFVLPGFQNAHSHAFQYAMAGMAERHPAGSMDNFWSWREAMYKCALGMSPDQVEATATMLYVELIRKGYTHVAEFHYLHNDKSGKSYSNRAEMGERLVAAAQTAGIKITLVPVLYQKGNFGEAPQTRQRRFITPTIDNYFQLLSDSEKVVANNHNSRLGFGVHSLRAVDPSDIISTYQQGPKNMPFHLHAAEQVEPTAGLESPATPGFVALGMCHLQIALTARVVRSQSGRQVEGGHGKRAIMKPVATHDFHGSWIGKQAFEFLKQSAFLSGEPGLRTGFRCAPYAGGGGQSFLQRAHAVALPSVMAVTFCGVVSGRMLKYCPASAAVTSCR